MAVRIPTTNLAAYFEVVTIEGVAYTIGFNWNSRDETWRIKFQTVEQVDIVQGIKILPSVNLTARFKDVRLPQNGDFFCFNIVDNMTPPGRNGLVEDVQIWFLTKEDSAQFNAGLVRAV